MTIIKTFIQTIAFLLELAMLASLGFFGYTCSENTFLKYFFATSLPIIAMVLWGVWAAPKSDYRLETPYRFLFELTLLLFSAFLLYKSGMTNLATMFGILIILSQLLAFILKL